MKNRNIKYVIFNIITLIVIISFLWGSAWVIGKILPNSVLELVFPERATAIYTREMKDQQTPQPITDTATTRALEECVNFYYATGEDKAIHAYAIRTYAKMVDEKPKALVNCLKNIGESHD